MTIWKDIPGWDNYQVSDGGNVRSKSHKLILKKTRGGRAKNYHRVMLTSRTETSRKRRNAYVHHLVLEAFCGPRIDELPIACHKNDKGFDNRLANLYWGTKEDNQNDKYINALPDLPDAPF